MKIRQTKYLRNFWLALNMFVSEAVFPDLAIYWTLGNLSKPLATINLPKSPTFLGNLVKVVSSDIIFRQLL